MSTTQTRSKLQQGFAIAQASILMLGVVSFMTPAAAFASEIPQTCTFVSDASTQEGGHDSVPVPTPVNPAWTAAIPGTTWIWGELLSDTDAQTDKTEAFTKSFTLTGSSTASLDIASDNGYVAKVNGTVVDDQSANPPVNNFSSSHHVPDAALAAALHTDGSTNTLEIDITNSGVPGSTALSNPAGLLYKLSVTAATCGTAEVPPTPPNTLKVHILKYLQTGEGEVAASGTLPAFPMTATWNATNIGDGTGTYSLNAAGFGGAGAYAADTAAMTAPADYSTNEVPNGDTVIGSDSTCSPGKYRLVGYQTGDSLSGALTATISTNIPSFQGLNSDKYVVVVNEKCPDAAPQPSVTVIASKVICNDEKDLPNWGASSHPDITATTAADWVSSHEGCHLADGWDFQWGDQNAGDAGMAFTGEAPGYTTFGPTTTGIAMTTIPLSALGDGTEFHLREVLQNGYIPFTFDATHQVNDNNISAEFYCTGDGVNYDNFDFIRNPAEGSTKYCVAFNAPKSNDGGEQANGTLTIVKHTAGGNGTFNFNVTGHSSVDISTTEGEGTQDLSLAAGSYDVSENVPSGWSFSGVSCVYDNESVGTSITNGEHITLATGDHVTCTFDNTKQTHSGHGPVQTESGSNNGDVGGGSTGGGKVLGESTSTPDVTPTCGPLLTGFLKMGWKNDTDQVKKLQTFLNDNMHLNLPVTGFFGQATYNAVKAYQKGSWEDVLKPWFGLAGSGISSQDTPTGYVYQTTKWHINNDYCPGSEAFPTELK